MLPVKSNPVLRCALIGSGVNSALCLVQTAGGILFRSPALLADALHTATDLVSDVVVMIGSRLGQAPPDREHPYGHGKFETLAQLFIAGLMIATGLAFAVHVYSDLMDPRLASPSALWIAVVTLISKEALYRYTATKARDLNNRLLAANAWHHRTDAISSVAVLISLAGARLGYPFLDPLAGLLIATAICITGVNFGRKAINDLVEGAVDEELIEDIRKVAAAQLGVRRVHQVRARRVGSRILADLHILVDGHISVSDGHQIAVRVSRAVGEESPMVEDVLTHIDPEDDEEFPTTLLRAGEELEREARRILKSVPGVLGISHITVHYLQGRTTLKLEIEVSMEQNLHDAAQITRRARLALQTIDGVDDADVHLEIEN